uniref:IS30 family transposase n=1 Tax=Rhodococcus opacus TaxID=37919 RepID=UPI0015FDBBFF|nr:IS30 family transposase [Rhodococcus opacus]
MGSSCSTPPPSRLLGIGGGRATSPHRGPAEQRPWSLLDSGSPWSAGCDESRTSGAEGGPGKRAGSNPGTAPRSDPYIVGRSSRSSIGTLVDRRSRYVRLLHLPGGHRAEPFAAALGALFEQIPEHARWTITWDQGAEMARHDLFGHLFAEGVYFAHPAAPWMRGTNENTNGLLRQYFPKGTDLSVHGPEVLREVEERLNNRPRKNLDWRTPAQVFAESLAP